MNERNFQIYENFFGIRITCALEMQILKKDVNPDFYEVVKGVGGIVLNTSFNLAGDPIVETPHDALMTLKNSEMDAIIINDFLIEQNK